MSMLAGRFPSLPRVPAPRHPVPSAQPPELPNPKTNYLHPRQRYLPGWTSPNLKLVALRQASSNTNTLWVFLCRWCAREFQAYIHNVAREKTTSCGCQPRGSVKSGEPVCALGHRSYELQQDGTRICRTCNDTRVRRRMKRKEACHGPAHQTG